MKTSGILSAAVLVVLLVSGQSAAADGWSLWKLLPFGKKEATRPARKSFARPSPLEKLDDDMKKFNEGTKKFFAQAVDALRWKKPDAKKRPTKRYLSWIREPKDPRYLREPKKQKKSWWDSLFRREEPKRVDSMKDWVGLSKPEM